VHHNHQFSCVDTNRKMQQANSQAHLNEANMHPAAVRRTVQQTADMGQMVSATIASAYSTGIITQKHMQRLHLLLSFLMDRSAASVEHSRARRARIL